MLNHLSLDTLCAALSYAMGIGAPSCAAEANPTLCRYVDEAFRGEKADRVFMYNPDAIAQWIYEKYPDFFAPMISSKMCEALLEKEKAHSRKIVFPEMRLIFF